MRESDIRSEEFTSKVKALYKLDQASILKRQNEFTDVNCPACSADNKDFFYERDGFNFMMCNGCETVFVSPRPSQELVIEHYKTSLAEKYWIENVCPKADKARTKHLVIPRVKYIVEACSKYGIPKKLFTDIGAGFGQFCEQIKRTKKFNRVIAVEPAKKNAEYCRDKGIEVIEDFFENIMLKNINVITCIESIEHIFDPLGFIKKIYSALANPGLLYMTTPNIKGFDLLTLKDKSDNTTAPDHLNYFHPESIRYLLEKCRFNVLEISTPGKLDAELVRKKVLSKNLSLENQPFLKRILIDEWDRFGESFQEWLADNGLSSHMVVLAMKNGNPQ